MARPDSYPVSKSGRSTGEAIVRLSGNQCPDSRLHWFVAVVSTAMYPRDQPASAGALVALPAALPRQVWLILVRASLLSHFVGMPYVSPNLSLTVFRWEFPVTHPRTRNRWAENEPSHKLFKLGACQYVIYVHSSHTENQKKNDRALSFCEL